MYRMTEVELTEPALIALFGKLADALGHSLDEEPEKLSFNEAGLMLAVVAWHDAMPWVVVCCGGKMRIVPKSNGCTPVSQGLALRFCTT